MLIFSFDIFLILNVFEKLLNEMKLYFVIPEELGNVLILSFKI
jgi:hypothetical protein